MQFSLTLPQAAKRQTELGGYFDRISALCAAATDMCSGGGCELWPSGEDALAGAWRSKQTDSHVRVFWYLPSKFKSRDVAFSCSDLRLSVGLKGHEPLLAGEFAAQVKGEDAYWEIATVSGKRCARVVIEKRKPGAWRALWKADAEQLEAEEAAEARAKDPALQYREAFSSGHIHKDMRSKEAYEADYAKSVERDLAGKKDDVAEWEHTAVQGGAAGESLRETDEEFKKRMGMEP